MEPAFGPIAHMRFVWWKKKATVIAGIDIGSSSVKVVELGRKGKSLELLSAGVAELEGGAIVDGEIRNTRAVANVVAKLLEDRGVAAHDAATSVAGNAVIVKRIVTPEAEGEALTEGVLAEAQRQLSSGISELNIDYQVLGPGTAPKTVDVMLVAARRETVGQRAEVLASAGRHPVLVDVDAFAIQNAFETAYQPAAGKTVALFNLGASLINMNVVRDGVPLFTRDIAADAQYTAALQKSLNVSASEAEALKKGRDGAAVTETFLGSIDAAREAFLDSLASEVHQTLSYLHQMAGSTTSSDVDAAYVSGGVASLPGLCDRLQRELNAPVEVLNPLRGMRTSESTLDEEHLAEISPRLAVAVGLALRSFDER